MIGERRILLLNYEYPPLGGGAGVATAALARELAGSGATVDVVTAAPPGRDRSTGEDRPTDADSSAETSLGDGRPPCGPRVIRVPSRRRGTHDAGIGGALTYVLSAAPVVARLLAEHRYDVAHLFFSLPTGLLLPLVRRADIPTVVSLRGSDVPGYDPFNRRLQLLHRLFRPVTRAIWRKADRVVALGESLAELAKETDPDLSPAIIRNGVDLERFHPGPRDPAPPSERPVRCLAAARLVPRKGLADLLRAWGRLPRGAYRLEIAGEGTEEERLKALAVELGVEEQVEFLGVLGRQQMAERLRKVDLFTLAPHSEAFGNVFAEALASGVPIVASQVGGIPGTVEDGVNGLLVTPGRPEELARAIERLGRRPDWRASISARNRRKAEKGFSWTRMARAYAAVYEEVLAAGSEAADEGCSAGSGEPAGVGSPA